MEKKESYKLTSRIVNGLMLSHKSGSNVGGHATHDSLTSVYDMPYSSVCKGGLQYEYKTSTWTRCVAMVSLFTLPIACDILLLFGGENGCQICFAPGL